MSEEFNNYISKMKSTYKLAEDNIRSDFETNNYKTELNLLVKNNQDIKEYLLDTFNGKALKDDKENLKALAEIEITHKDFMKFYYDIIGWDILR